MADDEIPPDVVLPCGCVMRCAVVNGVNTLTYIPCHKTCPNYRNALAEAARDGITPEFRRAP